MREEAAAGEFQKRYATLTAADDAGQAVERGGNPVGEVTSGNFSPVLGCGIALVMADPSLEPGMDVTIAARGSQLAGTVVELPFVG